MRLRTDDLTVTFLDLTPPLDLPAGLPFEVEQFIQHECSNGQYVVCAIEGVKERRP